MTKIIRNKKALPEEGLGGCIDSSEINAPFVSSKTVGSSQAEEGNESGGKVAALRMAEESEEIISRYTDAQALEDGVLVEVSCGAVNRVTCAVFYHFARPMENSPDGLETFDTAPLMAGIRAVLGVMPDEDGWRQFTYEGKELWLVPNEVRGLTLMFPNDC